VLAPKILAREIVIVARFSEPMIHPCEHRDDVMRDLSSKGGLC
jgi:hypothetical protein